MASSQVVIPPYDRNGVSSTRSLPTHQDVYPTAASGVFASLDRDKVKRDPKATMMALAINGFALAGVLWLGAHTIAKSVLPAPAHVVTLVAPLPPPPPLPKAPPKVVTMSGGGGHPMAQPVTRGNPPALAPKPVMLVSTAPPRIQPRLAIQPTLNVQPTLKLAKADVPALGMATGAPAVTVSLGNGAGAGIGAGSGNGLGSGSGGNYGGGVFKVGGGVAAPTVISAPEPTFTEEARQAKVSGKVVVYLQVSPDGHPMHVRVVRGLGMGLDEKAIEAVRQYKFKPATKDGHPVTVEMNVDVNFQIL